ncbi:MAG: [protein-PII] uridylyltransferase [Candidatus Hydrogenedentes bacterium]|nr:[protein-PII] uridylyltransferase [Candidatus Hydrogenedentota bacterium]
MKNIAELIQTLASSSNELISAEEFISSVRQFRAERTSEIFSKTQAGISSRSIIRYLSELSDIIIEACFYYSISRGVSSKAIINALTVCALGGYGRCEVSPRSDLDICILYSSDIEKEIFEGFIQNFTSILWDSGFEVGISVGSVEDLMESIVADVKTFTSYIHTRKIIGREELLQSFREKQRNLSSEFKAKILTHIRKRLDLSSTNPQYSLYTMEPNIKESAGGLRDYHAILWLLALEDWDIQSLEDAKNKGLIDGDEYLSLIESLDFLWRVRNDLHLRKSSSWDLLSVDMQIKLSSEYGYGMDTSALERFMEDYFTSASKIRLVFEHLVRRLDLSIFKEEKFAIPKVFYEEKPTYSVDRGYLTLSVKDSKWFLENPPRLMELMWEVSRRRLPVSYGVNELVMNSLSIIDDTFRANEVVNRFFFEICSNLNSIGFTLREMIKLGILQRYIPEFGAIVGVIRYGDFHSYPVDEHTVRAIEAIQELPKYTGKIGNFLNEVFKNIKSPTVVILALLFHDLGKVEGEEHIEAGVRIARTICARMGLDDSTTEHIAFLVKYHQLMVDVALYRDIDDIEVIQAFTYTVEDLEKLDELLIVSYADLFAVGPGVWNEWKGSLLIELHSKAMKLIRSGESEYREYKEIVKRRIKNLVVSFEEEKRPRLENHLNLLTPGYLDSFTTDEILVHLECVDEAVEKGFALRCSDDETINMSNIVISTRDKRGLFAEIAGCFASLLIDIHSASLFTREDGWVVDCFLVRDPVQHRPLTETQIMSLEKVLRSVLLEGKDVQALVDKARSKLFAIKKPNIGDTIIKFDNESSARHTVIDIETPDRTGLLYDIAYAFSVMGINIYKAKINTGTLKVKDSFYVDFMGGKISNRILQSAVRAGLLESIRGRVSSSIIEKGEE